MPLNVGQLFASLQLNTQQFFNSMNQAHAGLIQLGNSMRNLGMKMSLGISLPLTLLGGKAIKAASDLNENFNKVNEVFKENADVVKKWSESSLRSFGMAQSTALDMASQFGDMGTSMGLTTKVMADMSMNLVKLGGDMASFKNIPFAQVKTALNAVFTGETESLKLLGIVITEQNLKEYLLAKGIKERYEKMDQASRVQLRYAYILDKTRNSQGDFERTQAGAANQMRIFEESLKQLSATFGAVMLPTFTKVITKLNAMLEAFAKLDPKVKESILKWGAFAIVLGPILVIMGSLISAVGSLIKGIGILSAFIGGLTAVTWGWIGVIIAAIAVAVQLGFAAVVIKENWTKLQVSFLSAGLAIYETFRTLSKGIKLLFFETLEEINLALAKFAYNIPDLPGLRNFKMGVGSLALGIGKAIDSKQVETADELSKSINDLMVSLKLLGATSKDTVAGLTGTSLEILKGIADKVGLKDIMSLFDVIKAGGKTTSGKSVDELIKEALTGLKEVAGKTGDETKRMIDDLIAKVKQLAETFKDSLGGLFDSIQPSKKISAKKLILLENMKLKMMEEFKSTMDALGERIGFKSELFNEIIKQGPSSLKTAKNILGMNDQMLQGFNENFMKRSQLSFQLGTTQAISEQAKEKALSNVAVNLNGGVYVGNMQSLANMIVKELKVQGVY